MDYELAPLAALLSLRLAYGLGAREMPEMSMEEIVSDIAIDAAVAALTLFAAYKVGGWRARFLWMVTAALMLAIALDRGVDLVKDGARTGCWPWHPCETFRARFNFTVPLYPLPPTKGDRVRREPPQRTTPWNQRGFA